MDSMVSTLQTQREVVMPVLLKHASAILKMPLSALQAVVAKCRRQPITLATCGWSVLLLIFVTAPTLRNRYWETPKFVALRTKVKSAWKYSPLQLPLAGAVAWVGCRALYRAGLTSVVEIVALGGTLNYVLRNERKRASGIQLELQKNMQNPEYCLAMLGDQIPRWISFPNIQRAAWLNSILAGLWPSVCEATKSVVTKNLAVTLANSKPSFLTRLELVNFNLGTVPPHVEGIQHHMLEATETVVDLHLSWRSEGFEVRFAAGVSPLVVVEAAVTDFTFHFVVRVTAGPHLPAFPCLGAASVSILGTPHINFRLKAAKLSLDAIPGLSQWVDDFIRKTLVAKMVYPRQLFFPIAPGFDMTTRTAVFDHRAAALGKLRVTLHEALNLTTGLMDANSYHVEVGLVGATDALFKSAEHSEHNGVASFAEQRFNCTLHDNTATFGFWLYRDDIQRKKLIGERLIPMADMMAAEKDHITLELLHHKGKECRVQLKVSWAYSAFASSSSSSHPSGLPSGTFPAPPSAGPARSSSIRRLPASPTHRHPSSTNGTPRHSTERQDKRCGTLFIRVENCKDLRNYEAIGTSDPYVVLSACGRTVRTQVVDDCLNPVFNFDTEMEIDDVMHAVLDAKVFDENMTKDVLMATTAVPLIDVVRSNGQLAKQTWSLSPQGTITMTLTLRMEG